MAAEARPERAQELLTDALREAEAAGISSLTARLRPQLTGSR
jgi:hypothetical protein